MASADTTRIVYHDGLLLGARHLAGDQAYFRAANERRSLALDMFGVAFGLELARVRPASRPDSDVLRVQPGVAYGGDGRVIVVRRPEDLSPLLRGQSLRTASYAVHLVYGEREAAAGGQPPYPGAAPELRVVEGYRFELAESPPEPAAAGRREGPRVAPCTDLGGKSDPAQSRICLGIIDFDPDGKASVRPSSPRQPYRAAPPSAAPGEAAPAQGAQYIGLVGASLAHPHAWTAAQGGALTVAMELDPQHGVLFHHEVIHHAHVLLSGREATFELKSDGGRLSIGACGKEGVEPLLELGKGAVEARRAIVAREGIACELPVEGDAAGLPRRAVAWGHQGVRVATKDDRTSVLGIVASVEGERARVVTAGVTMVRVRGAVRPGDWLGVTGDEAGALAKAGEIKAGTLVAKALEPATAGGEISVIVCMA